MISEQQKTRQKIGKIWMDVGASISRAVPPSQVTFFRIFYMFRAQGMPSGPNFQFVTQKNGKGGDERTFSWAFLNRYNLRY